ncbi:uncharacterized protein LOC109821294 [Asparagus officinalis]|uniref:uncharacterized protein LOC109821294 n=1 Tax=Asparagus officinalis TaxID=4686 RepID=UPI00098E457D|nr:uncharacterized protein LOC109821294 [Asparagus officinalis]
MKTKRKDLEEVYDEFSEFSLNSPARKIRRLDAELPPIMEEEDQTVPLPFENQMPQEVAGAEIVDLDLEQIPLNEERALVLYKPVDNHLVVSPSSTFSVNPDLIYGLKNQALRAVTAEEMPEDKQAVANNSLAVIPWAPSHASSLIISESGGGIQIEETMKAEEGTGGASMEVEESGCQTDGNTAIEGFHQRQQHCMVPQPPQNVSTPIMWSWGIGT